MPDKVKSRSERVLWRRRGSWWSTTVARHSRSRQIAPALRRDRRPRSWMVTQRLKTGWRLDRRGAGTLAKRKPHRRHHFRSRNVENSPENRFSRNRHRHLPDRCRKSRSRIASRFPVPEETTTSAAAKVARCHAADRTASSAEWRSDAASAWRVQRWRGRRRRYRGTRRRPGSGPPRRRTGGSRPRTCCRRDPAGPTSSESAAGSDRSSADR